MKRHQRLPQGELFSGKQSPLEWLPRAKVITSDVSIRRRWGTRCGRYAVEHVAYQLRGLQSRWRLLGPIPDSPLLIVLSTHRTRGGAERAAKRHQRKSFPAVLCNLGNKSSKTPSPHFSEKS